LKGPLPYRIGIGFDAHNLRPGRRLVLGGTVLPCRLGLAGHSDGDVLLHAITDALLGALALPDIGTLFPDTDPNSKGAASTIFLNAALGRMQRAGYRLLNLDCILVCDRPRLSPYAQAIRTNIARLLGTTAAAVGLKAKTSEGTRLALPNKSIAAFATVLLCRRR